MKLYSVYDKKSMVYGSIMTCQDEVQAVRFFERAVMDSETMMFHYPEDFVLCYLGSIDDKTGVITPESMPMQIREALACFPAEK